MKIKNIFLLLLLSLLPFYNSFAYDLTESDKKGADVIISKLENFISKK